MNLKIIRYLITGAAGFIGFHLAKRLLEKGNAVIGIDNLNDYYDARLKYARLQELEQYPDFQFVKMDIADKCAMNELFAQNHFDIVCNFAAQAGVTYSTVNPNAYIHSNIIGFINVLECCKEHNCKLIYASSSSVYGDNKKLPFAEADPIAMPKNLYAKTKINNEYLVQMYSDHFGLQTICLRLFSVYGTFGRPDMGYMIFIKSILNHLPLNIYGDGTMKRDYTYIDDVVTAIQKIISYHSVNKANNEIYNIGSSNPVSLVELIEKLENQLGTKAIKNFLPKRPEEIGTTYADVSKLKKVIGYKPNTSIDDGIKKVVGWWKLIIDNQSQTL
ncbi:MAG: GDP-mannose 4,6-dehydratase [Bacteroidales bacterium]|nr:GDP-mannose 4,6-dehydratase [Bacteroidales bacterium]